MFGRSRRQQQGLRPPRRWRGKRLRWEREMREREMRERERASWEWQEHLAAQRLQDEADKKRKEEEKERQRQEERDKRQQQQREKRELQKQRGLQEKEAKTGAAPPPPVQLPLLLPPPVQLPAAAKTPGAAPEVKKRYSMDYSRFNQLDDSDEEDQVPAPKQAGGPPIDLAIKRTTERTASPLPPAAAGAEEKKEREQERLKKERREEAKRGVEELRQRAAAQCKLRHLVCPHAECRVLLSHLPEFCASPSSCPACRGPLSRAMFARCRREDELSSALQRALGSDGLRVLLPANAEAILEVVCSSAGGQPTPRQRQGRSCQQLHPPPHDPIQPPL